MSGTFRETNVGDYVATASLEPGYVWEDDTATDKIIAWSIAKADGPAAPSGLQGVKPTRKNGADGKIKGTTAAMEIADNAGFADAREAGEGQTSGYAAGTYYVRVKSTATHEAGDYATVSVPAYVPAVQGGGSENSGGNSDNENPPVPPADLEETGSPAQEEQAEPRGAEEDGSQQSAVVFTDTVNHWAKNDIDFAVSRGLFRGTSADTFSPEDAMTRGMFVTVLGRLATAEVKQYGQSRFVDVSNNAYYMGYVEWASENGIVSGIGNGAFAPNRPITREQLAVMMLNYAKTFGIPLPNVQEAMDFADNADISAYAKEAVKQMQMAGILSGKSGNRFDPKGTATRAEVAAVLHRFAEQMDLYGNRQD